MLDELTDIVRRGAADELLPALRGLLAEYRPPDDRDLMWTLAPIHDCARRLGRDPVALFDAAAAAAAGKADLVRAFGRRTDVTPRAFAFAVVDEPDGPRYRWTD